MKCDLLWKVSYKSRTSRINDLIHVQMYALAGVLVVSKSKTSIAQLLICITFLALPNCNYFQVTIGKRISGLCQILTEKITNKLLSLKLPGEEYSVVKNDHQAIILGKQESHDFKQLTVQEGQVSFKLPFLDDNDLKTIFENTSEVGVEVCRSNSEPCKWA